MSWMLLGKIAWFSGSGKLEEKLSKIGINSISTAVFGIGQIHMLIYSYLSKYEANNSTYCIRLCEVI